MRCMVQKNYKGWIFCVPSVYGFFCGQIPSGSMMCLEIVQVKVSTVEVVPEQNHKELKRLSCDILKVCVVGFKKGKLKILMRFCSSTLMCSRHHAACEKLKKVLGAYPEAPLNIECLMEVPFLYQDSLLHPAVP